LRPISPAVTPPSGCLADAVALTGALDILVNNAGVIRRSAAEEYADGDWDDVIAVNLSSVFRLSRAAAGRWSM
jgi:2-dehydro-3-deoxy-D-gluconate 5-dehydrogenase